MNEPNGKILTTEGAGKAMWKELQVAGSIVTVNSKGFVSLPKDPRISDGKIGHVTVTVPSHPDISTGLDIPFRYDLKYVANFSGAGGSKGMDGTDGIDGMSDSPGSIDPNNPSAGGNGSDGTNGSDGSNGEPGGDAPPVMVKVALQSGSHSLLQVSVSARGKQKLYLVDPNGGSLTVKADAGEGSLGAKEVAAGAERGRHRPSKRRRRSRRFIRTRWVVWTNGAWRFDYGHIRSSGRALLERNPSLKPEQASSGVQGGIRDGVVVSHKFTHSVPRLSSSPFYPL